MSKPVVVFVLTLAVVAGAIAIIAVSWDRTNHQNGTPSPPMDVAKLPMDSVIVPAWFQGPIMIAQVRVRSEPDEWVGPYDVEPGREYDALVNGRKQRFNDQIGVMKGNTMTFITGKTRQVTAVRFTGDPTARIDSGWTFPNTNQALEIDFDNGEFTYRIWKTMLATEPEHRRLFAVEYREKDSGKLVGMRVYSATSTPVPTVPAVSNP